MSCNPDDLRVIEILCGLTVRHPGGMKSGRGDPGSIPGTETRTNRSMAAATAEPLSNRDRSHIMATKNEAAKLWDQLKNNLLGAQESLETIVTTKAWEPLGYATFHEAWAERMAGVKLAGAMEATVVYAMFDSGATDVDVALSVDGVGPKRARAYVQAHRAGLPAKSAEGHVSRMLRPLKPGETVIPAHIRRKAERKNSIRMEGFTDDEIMTWKRDAEEKGITWQDYCTEQFRQAMNNVSVVNGHVNA